MGKKNYDLDKMTNELKGASAFFQRPSVETDRPSTEEAKPKSPNKASKTESADTTRTPVRPVRPVRRQMVRHPFDIYHDQLESLRQLALEDRMRGEVGSMSAMVREALDRIIDERNSST